MFDLSRDVVLEGTIVEVWWRNPHVYFAVEVPGPNGEPVIQQIEAPAAGNLATVGLNATSLEPGDRVVVRVKPHRRGERRVALGWTLTRSDGFTIPLHPLAAEREPPVTARASSLAGIWVPRATEMATFSRSVRWQLTDKGRAAVADTAEARNAARSDCMPFGPPMLMALPAAVTVAVTESRATFEIDALDAQRVVHLDRAGHPPDLEPTVLGHSIGRWEGGTLVVDTIGYAAHPEGFAFDLPSSAAKRTVERFTLSADGTTLEYDAFVEDPEYLAEPLTQRLHWDYRPEHRPSGLPCDRESASRFAAEE